MLGKLDIQLFNVRYKHPFNTELEGKIALVTGGTKGIGRAIADRLARAGAKVIVKARNHPSDTDLKYHFIEADCCIAKVEFSFRRLIIPSCLLRSQAGRLRLCSIKR